ncbi:DegT/DnrJ/EryC1/StrS aminotransferase [Striga asiatica]|uniref:DegT/DnrJ/EryC1/StrS aminotransferase n=1 Tax=Striga asiatica TaxID=4170 RepID=A0A5A7P4A5_STRAF|nr:DegT/DnrJ/EryC1/StrS aminotransferase [Striga asiatica]
MLPTLVDVENHNLGVFQQVLRSADDTVWQWLTGRNMLAILHSVTSHIKIWSRHKMWDKADMGEGIQNLNRFLEAMHGGSSKKRVGLGRFAGRRLLARCGLRA